VVIHFNDLSGNSTAGVENDSSVTTVNPSTTGGQRQRAPKRHKSERYRFARDGNVNVLPELTAASGDLDVATDGTDAGNCELGLCDDRLRVESSTVGGTIDVGPGL